MGYANVETAFREAEKRLGELTRITNSYEGDLERLKTDPMIPPQGLKKLRSEAREKAEGKHRSTRQAFMAALKQGTEEISSTVLAPPLSDSRPAYELTWARQERDLDRGASIDRLLTAIRGDPYALGVLRRELPGYLGRKGLSEAEQDKAIRPVEKALASTPGPHRAYWQRKDELDTLADEFDARSDLLDALTAGRPVGKHLIALHYAINQHRSPEEQAEAARRREYELQQRMKEAVPGGFYESSQEKAERIARTHQIQKISPDESEPSDA